jgi:predicted ATPase
VGKTRLALQVAHELQAGAAFPDGVSFIPLAAVRQAERLAGSLAAALNLRERRGGTIQERLFEFLHSRQALLVLDNFEQLMPAAAQVSALLEASPSLRILVTSRELLRLSAERGYPVPPLSLPDPRRLPPLEELASSESVRLFVTRAQAVRPDFVLTPENAASIAEICTRLDGLPLALELAAARLRLLSPAALLARLDRRLPLLSGGPRDVPERQQTLRNAIAWSYDLLEPAEKRFFRGLAVFSGGFSLAAAEAVCTQETGVNSPGTGQSKAAFELLSTLVDKSLVKPIDHPEEPRFILLETIREFAQEQLEANGELEELRERQAGFYLRVAKDAEAKLRAVTYGPWFDQLIREHDNIRVALRWFLDRGETEPAVQFAAAMNVFWWVSGNLSEGLAWTQEALKASAGQMSSARAGALQGAGQLAWDLGEAELGIQYYEQSIAVAEAVQDRLAMARALDSLGYAAGARGQPAKSVDLHQRSLKLFEACGDRQGAAYALNNQGLALIYLGEYDRARQRLEESLALFEDLGYPWGIYLSLHRLAILLDWESGSSRMETFLREKLLVLRAAHLRVDTVAGLLLDLSYLAALKGDVDETEKLAQESFDLYNQMGDRSGMAIAQMQLGLAHLLRGEARAAEGLLMKALQTFVEIDEVVNLSHCLAGLAGLAALDMQFLKASRYYGAALALASLVAYRPSPSILALYEMLVDRARNGLEEADFEAASAEGRIIVMTRSGRAAATVQTLMQTV